MMKVGSHETSNGVDLQHHRNVLHKLNISRCNKATGIICKATTAEKLLQCFLFTAVHTNR